MTLSPAKKLAIVVGVQLLVVLSVIGFKQYTIWTGETVVLRVAPVDPRDPFRGDYFTVRYDISRINRSLASGGIDDTVFVELREGPDGYWYAIAVHDDRRREFDDTVIIKGKRDDNRFNRDGEITLRYGIEELFIPEGSGGQIPWRREATIAVEVKVDRFGNAVARRLIVDGEPFELERD